MKGEISSLLVRWCVVVVGGFPFIIRYTSHPNTPEKPQNKAKQTKNKRIDRP